MVRIQPQKRGFQPTNQPQSCEDLAISKRDLTTEHAGKLQCTQMHSEQSCLFAPPLQSHHRWWLYSKTNPLHNGYISTYRNEVQYSFHLDPPSMVNIVFYPVTPLFLVVQHFWWYFEGLARWLIFADVRVLGFKLLTSMKNLNVQHFAALPMLAATPYVCQTMIWYIPCIPLNHHVWPDCALAIIDNVSKKNPNPTLQLLFISLLFFLFVHELQCSMRIPQKREPWYWYCITMFANSRLARYLERTNPLNLRWLMVTSVMIPPTLNG